MGTRMERVPTGDMRRPLTAPCARPASPLWHGLAVFRLADERVFLATLILAFSPGEKEQPVCVFGLAEDRLANPAARI